MFIFEKILYRFIVPFNTYLWNITIMVLLFISDSLLLKEGSMKKEDLNKQFGKKLRELRKMKGLTLEDLDERSGLHWKFIGQVERGQSDIALNNIAKLASGLGMDIDDLLLFCFPQEKFSKEGKEILAKLIPLLKSNKKKALRKLKVFIEEFL